MTKDVELAQWWQSLEDRAADRATDLDNRYENLVRLGLVSKVVVHRYVCARCGPLGTVIRIAGQTILRTKAYRLSSGLNSELSTEAGRQRNALDGKQLWPGYTIDVEDLAKSGPVASIGLNCPHHVVSVAAADILADAGDKRPGRPGPPTVF